MSEGVLQRGENALFFIGPVLVMGVGNPTRGDDGAGPAVIDLLSRDSLLQVELLTTQQLHIEDAARWSSYATVVVVDASLDGPEVDLCPVAPAERTTEISSHQLGPSEVLALARQLYGSCPAVWLCTVRGESFQFSAALSPKVHQRVADAAAQLRARLLPRTPWTPNA